MEETINRYILQCRNDIYCTNLEIERLKDKIYEHKLILNLIEDYSNDNQLYLKYKIELEQYENRMLELKDNNDNYTYLLKNLIKMQKALKEGNKDGEK